LSGSGEVKMFGMDVDGVLTDGGIYYGDGGVEVKRFHVHDGMGIALLGKAGVVPFVITGRTSEAVRRRCLELGVSEIHQGVESKLACLRTIVARYGVGLGDVAFVADDLPDLEILLRVGFPIAVANARDEVRRAAKLVTSAAGGNGAVREAIEWALRLNGRWEALISGHMSLETRGDSNGQA
jgi:3-deoxy-D-manno-octulosonate 8-phosphate phosphatase (KDO 8-P phosphatase)